MYTELLNLGSEALRKAALNQDAKNFILSNKVLFQTLKKAANRYIGGETLEQTVVKVKAQNNSKFKCSIEFMGEDTATEKEAIAAKDEFVKICREIKKEKLSSSVSLDLSHLGLNISKELCANHLSIICQEALKADTDVMISAEGHEKTNSVIEIYKKVSKIQKNVGITLQAYLFRTKDDFKELLKEKGKIRISKGAFETPKGLSLSRGEELDKVYLDYLNQLLSKKHPCSIATHDGKIHQEAKKLIQKYKPSKDMYEFESLLGIRHDQLVHLKEEGYQTKIYFVYGKEWYLYVCNRIAEYPLSIFQALSDIVQ